MISRKLLPSIVKKYLMAISGLMMVLFVLGHMVGNLQMFLPPEAINKYAVLLKELPMGGIWIARGGILLAAIIHVWMAILLTLENRQARPTTYKKLSIYHATIGSRYAGVTGSIILFFIVFHLAHYTWRIVYTSYQEQEYYTVVDGQAIYNVHKMVVAGFSKPMVSAFYLVALAMLCAHLAHGVYSMCQTLGLCTKKWKPRLQCLAAAYGWIIFLGFAAIPVAVMISMYTPLKLIPVAQSLAMGL